jgi:hypothetical protein
MMKHHALWIAVLLLTACGSNAGKDETQTNEAGAPASETTTAAAPAASNDPLVYPGSQPAGENRYTTSDPIEKVVAYYWDEKQPVRQIGGVTFGVSKPEKRDDGYLVQLTGIGGSETKPYVVYLTPKPGEGTDGRIRPITQEEVKNGVQL